MGPLIDALNNNKDDVEADLAKWQKENADAVANGGTNKECQAENSGGGAKGPPPPKGDVGADAPDPGKPPNLNDAIGRNAANLVRDVLKGRQPLDALSDTERQAAGQWYRGAAGRVGGAYQGEAQSYNVARAEFLEGTRPSISPTLPEFIKNGGL